MVQVSLADDADSVPPLTTGDAPQLVSAVVANAEVTSSPHALLPCPVRDGFVAASARSPSSGFWVFPPAPPFVRTYAGVPAPFANTLPHGALFERCLTSAAFRGLPTRVAFMTFSNQKAAK